MGDPCELSELGSSLGTEDGGTELRWRCSEGAWRSSAPRVAPLVSWGPAGGSLTEGDRGSGVRSGAIKGQRWLERRPSLSPAVGTAPPSLAVEGRWHHGPTFVATPSPRAATREALGGGVAEPFDDTPSFRGVLLPGVPRGG